MWNIIISDISMSVYTYTIMIGCLGIMWWAYQLILAYDELKSLKAILKELGPYFVYVLILMMGIVLDKSNSMNTRYLFFTNEVQWKITLKSMTWAFKDVPEAIALTLIVGHSIIRYFYKR